MMEKKYKLTEETINVDGRTLYRIEALKDFGVVEKGNKGGFIENESNLSQSGDCWVYGNAKVSDNAMVCGNAKVYGNARVYCNALVCGNAMVSVNALVIDKARVYGNAQVRGNAVVYDNAEISGDAKIFGNAQIRCDAVVCEDAKIYGHAIVCGNADVYGNARIYGNAVVRDNAQVFGNTEIRGDAVITSKSDYILFKNWWSSGRFFTWTRSNNMWKVGCFYGTGEELIEKAYKDSEMSGEEYERVVKYVDAILKANKL